MPDAFLSPMDSDALRSRISDCQDWVARTFEREAACHIYWCKQRDAAMRALRDLHAARTQLKDAKRRAV